MNGEKQVIKLTHAPIRVENILAQCLVECTSDITSQAGDTVAWVKHRERVVGFYLSVCKSSGKARHGQTPIRIN